MKWICSPTVCGADGDFAAFGRELHRIAHQRGEDPFDRQRVRFDRHFGVDVDPDLDALLARGRRDVEHRPAHRLFGAEARVGQPFAAGLEPRHVENVADDMEQIFAAGQNVRAIVAIFLRSQRPEGLASHQLRESDDRVERRAQFMTHVGEEFGLGAVGGFGLRFLLMIAFGEIGELLGLLLERAARLSELGDSRQEQPLGVDELLLMLFQRGDVGADRDIAAVARASLVDLQPPSVGKSRLVGARALGNVRGGKPGYRRRPAPRRAP